MHNKDTVVTLTVSGREEHNGFMLFEPFVCDGYIIVLTGKNGSGKTRFLESISNNRSTVEINGELLPSQEIRFITQGQLSPNFSGQYSDADFQRKFTSTLRFFDSNKRLLDFPFDPNDHDRYIEINDHEPFSYEDFYHLCFSIATKLDKKPSELTHDEIQFYFEVYTYNIFGTQNISTICNQYIKRKRDNEYNSYLANVKNENIPFLTDEEYINTFGKEPWKQINAVINSIFDGKFCFKEPDLQSRSYSYQALLIQSDTGLQVTVDKLSSGERTLFWLALTLFNSQYYDSTAIKVPKLLLLDEPDAFLHPKMVEKLYKVLGTFTENFNTRIFITTHSPTTVALASKGSTFVVNDNAIASVTIDEGVADLLDGITQISISPENRRQVFVESQYDVDVYQAIYSKLIHRSDTLDPKISLNFVSSGPKMPEQQLKDKATQVLGIQDETLLNEFVISINGVGNCVRVIGQVEALSQNGHESVRGIIDWDLKNQISEGVSVLAQNYAYSIENIALDPISILLLLHTYKPEKYTMESICGLDISWSEWLEQNDLLQESVDRFIYKIFERDNARNATLSYVSGKKLKTDQEYLSYEGHRLEKLVINKYTCLKSFARRGKKGELNYSIVQKSMITLTNGVFIPKAFENILAEVQG